MTGGGGGLKMAPRGSAATLLAKLNAEDAPAPEAMPVVAPAPDEAESADQERSNVVNNVTSLQRSNDITKDATNEVDVEEMNDASNVSSTARTVLPTNVSTNAGTRQRAQAVTREGSDEPSRGRGKQTPRQRDAAGTGVSAAERAERLARAHQIAAADAEADEIDVVTVRAPRRLALYIDRYVERMKLVDPKRRYRKQDAVAEMFAAFFADHPMPPAPEEEI